MKYVTPEQLKDALAALTKNPKIKCIVCNEIFAVVMHLDYRPNTNPPYNLDDLKLVNCPLCATVNKIPLTYYMAIIYALKDCNACVAFFWKDFGMCQLCTWWHVYNNIAHAFSIACDFYYRNRCAMNEKGIAEKLKLYEFSIIDTKEE